MRINQLDLIAFGPFTAKTIDLSQGKQGLHIIFGANEAGKSSSLRALRQLLYGIPSVSSDNFIHEYNNMRIGGQLLHSDGTLLSVIRRKGRTATLRSALDDKPLEDSALSKYLEGLNQNDFESMFGIDHDELIKGGKALCEAKGDLGQILFSAGAGIANVRTISEKLGEEAKEIFTPTGTKALINSSMAELKLCAAALKESEVPSSEWETHEKEWRDASDKKAALETTLTNKEQTISKLQRIREALPLVAQRAQLIEKLEQLKDAAVLPENFGEINRQVQLELRRTSSAEEEASKKLDELNKQIEDIHIPPGIIEQSVIIEDLQRQLGSNNKAMQDRSQLLLKRNEKEDAARTALKELGQPPEIENCDHLRLSVTGRSALQEVATKKIAAEERSTNTQRNLEQAKQKLESLEAELANLKESLNTDRLAQAVKRIEQHGALETQLRNLRAQYATYSEQLAVETQKLQINDNAIIAEACAKKDWLKLQLMQIPSIESIENFANEFDRKDQELQLARKTQKQYESELHEIEQKILKAQKEMDTPTEEALSDARARRENGWRLVKQAWKQGLEDKTSIADFSKSLGKESSDLAEIYEISVGESDQVADRLRREADRVAIKISLIASLEKINELLADVRKEISVINEETEKLQDKWTQLWKASEITARSPREMRAWILRFEGTLKKVQALADAQIQINTLDASVQEFKTELGTILQELGEAASYSNESLAGLVDRCHSSIELNQNLRTQREGLKRDIEKQRLDLAKWQTEVTATNKELLDCQTNWTNALKPLGLGADTTPTQAQAVISTLDRMFSNLTEAKDLRNRIERIDRDDKIFAENVKKLVDNLAHDLASFPPTQATGELNARLVKARTDKERLVLLSNNKKQKLEELHMAQSKKSECKNTLDQMCQEALCDNYESLALAAEKSIITRQTQNELNMIEQQLLRLSGGMKLGEFGQEVLSFDPDSIEPRIQSLLEEIAALKEERTNLDQKIGAEKTQLARINGGSNAAEQAERVQSLNAQIASNAEHYVRLSLAKFILNQGIERFREKNQNPILRRASEIFSELTLGSLSGLKEDYNDKGEQILVASRPDGTLLNAAALSEGTRDQLYLSLRLASLENYLNHHEAIPFIADDLLVNFDNERAVATIKILQALSNRTQVIFFTHHAHILDLIKTKLDASGVYIHRLADSPVQLSIASA